MAIAIIMQARAQEGKKLYPWKVVSGEEEKLNGACLDIIAQRKQELKGLYYPYGIREERIQVEEQFHVINFGDSDVIKV